MRPVVTEASGVERDGRVDRRQYGIESPVSSVIEVLKWALTLTSFAYVGIYLCWHISFLPLYL